MALPIKWSLPSLSEITSPFAGFPKTLSTSLENTQSCPCKIRARGLMTRPAMKEECSRKFPSARFGTSWTWELFRSSVRDLLLTPRTRSFQKRLKWLREFLPEDDQMTCAQRCSELRPRAKNPLGCFPDARLPKISFQQSPFSCSRLVLPLHWRSTRSAPGIL